MTEIGVGGAADRAEATRLYRSGANEGHAECENNLGAMLCAGADPDLAGAAALFERARRRGHAAACFNLAACFEDGAGVARDVERAAALYEKAAAAGVAGAHRAEGHLALVRGHLREATAKFVEGAVNGDPEAAEAARWLADLRKAATAAAAVREVPGSPGGTGDASRGASARTGSASANVSGANVSVSGANVSVSGANVFAFSRPPSQSRVTSLVGAASGTFDAAGDGDAELAAVASGFGGRGRGRWRRRGGGGDGTRDDAVLSAQSGAVRVSLARRGRASDARGGRHRARTLPRGGRVTSGETRRRMTCPLFL